MDVLRRVPRAGPQNQDARVAAVAAILTCAAAAHAGEWKFTTDTDRMTSKVTSTAQLSSENSLDLSFPYKGRNMGRLTVRQHPRYGLQVILDVEKGQVLCNSFNGCPVLIRFDDKPPHTFNGGESADNNPTIVFILDAKAFIAQASKAHQILVQVNFFQNGAQTLEFRPTRPLAWPATKK